MRFSYSRVDCFLQCPYKYKLRYIDKIHMVADQSASNALYLGSGLHKGIETTVEEGINDYFSHFYTLTNDAINWSIQLEYWIPKVKEILHDGQHEVEVNLPNYIGYIDYLTDDTIYDFKFTTEKNQERYMQSKQLHVYKYFLEKANLNVKIKHLKYIFIPKCLIRQKKNETIIQFRQRLMLEMSKMKLTVREVFYDDSIITTFLNDCKRIENTTEFPKNMTRLCDWCDYCNLCIHGEEYEIV